MQRGFKAVAPALIRERPGLPPEEYARMALQRELCGSDSKDRIFSLATTLRKEVREGRMPGIRVEKVNGKLCYFPSNYPSGSDTQPKKDMRIEVLLPPDVARRIDTLLELERFTSPSDAVIWLMQKGIEAHRAALDQIENQLQQIRRLKESAQGLV